MVDIWKEVAFNQCTMEEAMTIISLVQADLNASFVNKQRAPQ